MQKNAGKFKYKFYSFLVGNKRFFSHLSSIVPACLFGKQASLLAGRPAYRQARIPLFWNNG